MPILAVLPVATVLWTNLHGGFFVGALMILAYGGGEMLRLVFSPHTAERLPAWLKARSYFLSGLACLAASLINPYTYHLHVHMVQYLRDPWNSQHIMEFLSPRFHHPTAIFFEAMLVLAVAARGLEPARRAASPRRCWCWCGRMAACWRRAIFRFS